MLVGKATPPNWARDTLLLRFLDRDGRDTVFVVSDEALHKFGECELWRAYDLVVPGECVKRGSSEARYGVRNTLEVNFQFPCKLEVAKKVWPAKMKYQFIDWEQLNQLQHDQFVDLIGRVTSQPVKDMNQTLAKAYLVLAWGSMSQEVVLLGEHANLQFDINDVVAFAGLRMQEWKGVRTLQTAYLTVIERNPGAGEHIPEIPKSLESEPKRKVMRMKPSNQLRVSDVLQLTDSMLRDAENELATPTREFSLSGTLSELNATFFEQDVPILQVGEHEKMCWRTTLTDATGTIEVKIWDRACYQIFRAPPVGSVLFGKRVRSMRTTERISSGLSMRIFPSLWFACAPPRSGRSASSR